MRQDHLQFLRPAAVHSGRACARASASGGNRFTWISIIVIKHAASMNYLFVGMAKCMRRMENKKMKKGKGRKNSRWRRRRNTYRRVLQRLLVPSWMSPVRKRRKRKRKTVRELESRRGKKTRKVEKEDGQVPLSSSFRRTRASLNIYILHRALGSQSLRCVALIPNSATRGMTLTHRRTRYMIIALDENIGTW